MCSIAKLKIRKRCKTPEEPVSVVIIWKEEPVELCRKCWERIPPDLEWGIYPKPTVEEIFGRRTKEEAEATPTEYHLKGSRKLTVQDGEIDEDLE